MAGTKTDKNTPYPPTGVEWMDKDTSGAYPPGTMLDLEDGSDPIDLSKIEDLVGDKAEPKKK